jgi:ATP adenylyltransferase
MAKNPSMLDALHPYWRFAYTQKAESTGVANPFVGLENADMRTHHIIAKGSCSLLMLNKFPYAPGHLLALPYREVGNIEDLTTEESAQLQDFISVGKLLLQKVLKAQGVNIGLNQGRTAGGSVPTHLHWHIVPRWMGDHSFMPIIAGMRILTGSQQAVWQALAKAYKEIDIADKKGVRRKRR